MTCVVGFIKKDGSILMGSDSGGSGGGTITKRKDPKVFIKENMIFGFSGSFRMGNILNYKLKIPAHPKKMDDVEYMNTLFIDEIRSCLTKNGFTQIVNNEESMDGSFIVGYNGNIYTIDKDFQVGIPQKKYDSCGSGESFALGSLFSTSKNPIAEERVQAALLSACEFSTTCCQPIKIIELKSNKQSKGEPDEN